jgi:hypothetical protein
MPPERRMPALTRQRRSRMAGESRVVVGGRFAQGSDIPQPQSPIILIPAGLVVIALGVLIYLSG